METALRDKLKQLPETPGVYLFKDREGKLLYVGKALSLRKRVLSYFQPARPLTAKLMSLVRQTAALDWILTGSEAEALLYEQGMIREKQPKYNVLFRDDKTYPYLKVTAEEEFPRLFVGRGPSDPGVKRVGPFANAGLLRQAFGAVRHIIPFRTCKVLPQRACLDYHLRLCSAPCEGKISPEAYREDVAKVLRLMEGKKEAVLEDLRRRMEESSKARRYEEAAKIRDQIEGLLELASQPRRFVPARALADLQSVLQLPVLPRRVEGYDISNIFGRQPVGSLVTFQDGKPWKDGYRRFKIKTVSGIDDYAMMKEVLRRRFGEPWPDPDLVLIDGGRGHLNAALEVIKEVRPGLPAVGIAKEFEQLFLPSRSAPVVLPPESRALQLCQRVRDEAHRFAIGYHRLLRGKGVFASALDDIPGVGPRRKQDLLVRFGSVEEMRRASAADLAQVRGIDPLLAQRIAQRLKTGVRHAPN